MAVRDYAGRIYFVLSFLAFALVIVASSQPPLLRDYPDWVYQGVLLAKMLAGHPVAGYAIKHYPVPNSITTVGLALLTLSIGWMWAAKVWLLIGLGLSAVTTFIVARVFPLPGWMWWSLPTMLFFGQSFWYATVSFSMGSCGLLLLMCLLYQRKERAVPIAGLIIFCFFMHLIVYAAAGLLVLLYCLEHRRWKLTFVGLATLPLPVWYFLGRRATPSDETALGYSPALHLAVPAAVAVLFLLAVLTRQKYSLRLWFQRTLWWVGMSVFLLSAGCLLLPEVHLSPGVQSMLMLARMKGLAPFQLFGFVNLVYRPVEIPLRSATLGLLHRPLFTGLMLTDLVCGLLVLYSIARVLSSRSQELVGATAHESRGLFLRDYITLFGLLYLASPPNALGVISIDMRMAQLAFAPALLLLAQAYRGGHAQRAWRHTPWATTPLVMLLCFSLYQFAVSQHRFELETADTSPLRPQIASFAAVDPTAIAEEYDRLRAGRLEGFIFATGLFYQTIPWKHDATAGR